MAGIWKQSEKKLPGLPAVGANQADLVVSEVFKITPEGAKDALRVDVVVSSVTAAAGITLKLQQKIASSWSDVTGMSVAVTGNGTFSMIMNGRDTTGGYYSSLPLSNQGRITVTTGAGDAVTIDNVYITMED